MKIRVVVLLTQPQLERARDCMTRLGVCDPSAYLQYLLDNDGRMASGSFFERKSDKRPFEHRVETKISESHWEKLRDLAESSYMRLAACARALMIEGPQVYPEDLSKTKVMGDGTVALWDEKNSVYATPLENFDRYRDEREAFPTWLAGASDEVDNQARRLRIESGESLARLLSCLESCDVVGEEATLKFRDGSSKTISASEMALLRSDGDGENGEIEIKREICLPRLSKAFCRAATTDIVDCSKKHMVRVSFVGMQVRAFESMLKKTTMSASAYLRLCMLTPGPLAKIRSGKSRQRRCYEAFFHTTEEYEKICEEARKHGLTSGQYIKCRATGGLNVSKLTTEKGMLRRRYFEKAWT